MCVCVVVFASGPRQHSRERNGARTAAHPRRDTNPVGRRDCQDHSDREGQRHPTGESSTTSLKTVDRGDPSYHLFNKYCFRFSLGHSYSKDKRRSISTWGLYFPNYLRLKLQIGRFFLLSCSCDAVGMAVLDGSQAVHIPKKYTKGFHSIKRDIFGNVASMRASQRLTLTCFLNDGSSSHNCGVTWLFTPSCAHFAVVVSTSCSGCLNSPALTAFAHFLHHTLLGLP